MKDKEFLIWLKDRLVNVYGESENVDFVQKLDAIAQTTHPGLESSKVNGEYAKIKSGPEE